MSETLLKASMKNNTSGSRWRPHRDGISLSLSPICSHFIETVGKLRGTHSLFWQDFDPQPAGEHVAAEVLRYPPTTHIQLNSSYITFECNFSLFSLLVSTRFFTYTNTLTCNMKY